MKPLKYAVVLAFLSAPAFAAIGENNFIFTLNLGANRSVLRNYPVNATYIQNGFAVGFDIGYQHYTPKNKGVIQGNDLVIGLHYGMDRAFLHNGSDIPSSINVSSRPFMGYLSSTYSLGFYAAKTHFMFDVIGLQIMFGERQISAVVSGSVAVSQIEKPYGGVAFTMPLGFRVVLDMGLVVGFRHSYAIYGPLSLNTVGTLLQHHYNFSFVIGYSFGGGGK